MYLYKTNSNSGGETVMFTFSITLHSLKNLVTSIQFVKISKFCFVFSSIAYFGY